MNLSAAAVTHPGRVRQNNEDAYLVRLDRSLFVVCDGMGGYAGGEVASCLACNTIAAAFDAVPATVRTAQSAAVLRVACRDAHYAVAHAQKESGNRKMGTTVVALIVSGGQAIVAHAGDSACYRLRRDSLRRLTAPHVMPAVRHCLTNALGHGGEVEVWEDTVEAGDMFLLCSDGLTDELDDPELRDALLAYRGQSAEATAQALVDVALRLGGRDNVTALVVKAGA